MAEPMWVIEYQPVPDEAAIRADERRKVAAEMAKLREHEERAEKVMNIMERSIDKLAAKLNAAVIERDGLKAAIADVLALCREIRPDSVLGTSPAVRLKLIEDRLTLATRKADDRG